MISKSSQYRYLIFSTLFLLGTVLPTFIVLPIPQVGFTLPKIFFFAVTAVIGTMWLLLREDLSALNLFRTERTGQLCLYFIIVLLLSLSWSVMPVVSTLGAAPRFYGLLTYGICFSFMICALCLCQHPRGLRNIILSIVISNAGVVLYGFLQLIHLDPLSFFWDNDAFLGRIFSSLGIPTALASFIVLTLPFVVIKSIKAKGRDRLFYDTLVLLNFVVIMGTASRAGVLGLIVAIGLFTYSLWPVIRKRILNLTLQQQAITVFIGVMILGIGITSFQQRFSLESEQGRSWGSRQVMWLDSLEMISQRPQGYGLETMGILYPKYMSPQLHWTESLTSHTDRAHNKPLDLLLTLGPLGLLTYYLFIASLLNAAWRLRAKRGAVFAGGVGIAGYSVTLLFGFDTILTSVFFWLIAGLMMGIAWQADNKDWQKAENFTAGRIALVLLCSLNVISTVVFLQWSKGYLYLQSAEWNFQTGKLSQAVENFTKATAHFTYDRTILVRSAETALVTSEYSEDFESREILHQIAFSNLMRLEQLTKGMDGYLPLLRGWQAALRGEIVQLRQSIATAKELMPNTVDTYRIAAHSYGLVGDTSAVNKAYRDLIALLPPYWKDKESDAGRILWKENPWLSDVLTNSLIRDFTQWEEI